MKSGLFPFLPAQRMAQRIAGNAGKTGQNGGNRGIHEKLQV
jgi:hypothetical protein